MLKTLPAVQDSCILIGCIAIVLLAQYYILCFACMVQSMHFQFNLVTFQKMSWFTGDRYIIKQAEYIIEIIGYNVTRIHNITIMYYYIFSLFLLQLLKKNLSRPFPAMCSRKEIDKYQHYFNKMYVFPKLMSQSKYILISPIRPPSCCKCYPQIS